jgi:purine-cytosine permease-like protein
LIQAVIKPLPFAKFILVLLVLSGMGNNCISIYSAALSIQQFARPLQAVPRFLWTIVVLGGILALSIAGRDNLLDFLSSFLSLLGYWNSAFFVILFTEHYLFRGGVVEGTYDLGGWNDPSRLPLGWAALLAFAIGIAGCVVGMVQTS